MKRNLAIIAALLYLVGIAGVPVAVYSCVESGEAGVVASITTSPGSCYAETCCDSEEDALNDTCGRAIPCCDIDVKPAPENSRIVLPVQKSGQAASFADTPVHLPDLRSHAYVASAPSAVLVFHASVNLPLLS